MKPRRCSLLALLLAAAVVGLYVADGALSEATPSSDDPAARDPAVLFFEAFEDEGFRERFHEHYRKENLALVPAPVFDGERALRVHFEQGKHTGGSLRYKFREAGQEEPEELYGRYYLRFGRRWDPGEGGKLPGPAGTYGEGGWGGRKAKGDNGWSARMGFSRAKKDKSKTQLHYYAYHTRSGTWGDWLYWDVDDLGMLDRERWYCIETYVKLNTPGEDDGVLRGWVDGELAFERTKLRFRDVPELKIEEFWLNFYYGGTFDAPRDMHVYVDNLALSRKPIGPLRTSK